MVVSAEVGVTDLDPSAGMGPDQSLSLGFAEAVHEVTFVLDQESVTDSPNVTMVEDAEMDTVGEALPPHALMRHRLARRTTSSGVFCITPTFLRFKRFYLAVNWSSSACWQDDGSCYCEPPAPGPGSVLASASVG